MKQGIAKSSVFVKDPEIVFLQKKQNQSFQTFFQQKKEKGKRS